MVEIGQDSLKGHKFLEAIEILEKAVGAGNKSSRTHILLGMAYEVNGNWEKARQAYEAAQKLDPEDVSIKKMLERFRSL